MLLRLTTRAAARYNVSSRSFHNSPPCFAKKPAKASKAAGKAKKGKNTEKKLLLGRPSNNLKGGIVGLANVGKSSIFQAISRSHLGNPANYPFATIDPEEARVIVPSERFDKLCDVYKPENSVPATLTLFDIAGLVKGASKGEGLGNAFLANIRAVDGLFQVVRAFDDPEITHIEGSIDPTRDLKIVTHELMEKDIEFVLRALETAERAVKAAGSQKNSMVLTERKFEQAVCEKLLAHLESGKKVYHGDWTNDEIRFINTLTLLTAKPTAYIANVSYADYECYISSGEKLDDIKYLSSIREWIDENSPGDLLVPVCVEYEVRLFESSEAGEELDTASTVPSAIGPAISSLRKALNLISFFTGSPREVREWTIRQGSSAPEAAGVIHGDLEKTFIVAQVTKFDDVISHNGDDASLKSGGKIANKGKDYEMEDADCVIFKAANGKK